MRKAEFGSSQKGVGTSPRGCYKSPKDSSLVSRNGNEVIIMTAVDIDSRSNVRLPGREHIPIYPKGWIGIRIAQGVLALIVLGLAANGVSNFAIGVDSVNLILAMGVLTMLATIWHVVYEFALPAAFNYWAVLALDIFFTVLWLIAFPLVLADVAPAFSGSNWSWYSSSQKTILGTVLAAGAFGAVEFILFVACLIVGGIRLHRHRKAGLHCMPAKAVAAVPMTTAAPQPQQQFAAPTYPAQQPQQQPQQPQPQAYPPQPQGYPPQGQQPVYAAPQGGYYVPVPPSSPQPQGMVSPPPPQGFYSPTPPPQMVPQPTGNTVSSSGFGSTVQQQQQQQQQQHYPHHHQQQQQQPVQLPTSNSPQATHAELAASYPPPQQQQQQ
ncbi:hypothetical protein VTJ49DRAFT_6975 [Mycothermus thermophilus]|uniref:MARVEL domain-containing protein n=1 Tax=Humicola insolens TaxID=85995 RepID=A0ABR3V1K8_HUMIN